MYAVDSVSKRLTTLGNAADYAAAWRTAAFNEYYYVADNDKCMQNCTYPTAKWPTCTAGDYRQLHRPRE